MKNTPHICAYDISINMLAQALKCRRRLIVWLCRHACLQQKHLNLSDSPSWSTSFSWIHPENKDARWTLLFLDFCSALDTIQLIVLDNTMSDLYLNTGLVKIGVGGLFFNICSQGKRFPLEVAVVQRGPQRGVSCLLYWTQMIAGTTTMTDL